MIDIVIPYSLMNEGTELRYCLRGVEQYLTGVGNVFIVGDKPDWVKNVIHIPVKDGNMMWGKERNIFQKVMQAAKDSRVSDYFLYMNDDHFMVRDMDADFFPHYWFNTLGNSFETNDTPYRQTLANTIELLPMGKLECNFDAHYPMIFNSERFQRTFARVDWNKEYGYCMKTLYCVLNGVVGEFICDMKVSAAPTSVLDIHDAVAHHADNECCTFSIGDKVLNRVMRDFLEQLFPNKSKYE